MAQRKHATVNRQLSGDKGTTKCIKILTSQDASNQEV